MRLIHVNLKSLYADILTRDCFIHGFVYDENFEYPKSPRDAVLVLPGGGYAFVSYREKDPIMFKFNTLGYNSFALDYSCDVSYPTQHNELMCAVHYLNTHSEELGIKKGINLIGFSAGGHLASSYAGIYKDLNKRFDANLIKPKSLILAYPVTSLVKTHNDDCVKVISNFDDKIMHLLSADEHVDTDYPPVFMWTTKHDEFVDPNNVLWLKKSLDEKNVINKCIIYESDPHALALANESTYCGKKEWLNEEVSKWPELASQFIRNIKER